MGAPVPRGGSRRSRSCWRWAASGGSVLALLDGSGMRTNVLPHEADSERGHPGRSRLGIAILGLVLGLSLPAWGQTQEAGHAADVTWQAFFGLPPFTRVLLLLVQAVAVLTPVALLLTARAWWKQLGGVPARLHVTGVTLAAVALVWRLASWNLLGVTS